MKHLAIIADGNRRWAKERNLPIKVGYSQGLTTIENCCEWAIKEKVDFLTFYCFSTENWKRSQQEINLLEQLGVSYFKEAKDWYILKNIKVKFIGRKDRLSKRLLDTADVLEQATNHCTDLTLTICIDYGGRDEIARAIEAGARTEQEITDVLNKELPEPDVILRTGGQKRLSNFLLWQSAYSELLFLDCFFPDLKDQELDLVKQSFNQAVQNFGK